MNENDTNTWNTRIDCHPRVWMLFPITTATKFYQLSLDFGYIYCLECNTLILPFGCCAVKQCFCIRSDTNLIIKDAKNQSFTKLW